MDFDKEQTRAWEEIFKTEDENILIEGGAGTGKSKIAVMAALKYAEENKKVLLLMFNNPLKQSIENDVSEYCIDSDKIRILKNIKIETFYLWKKQKPAKGYDVVIIDEAQDIQKKSSDEFNEDDLKHLKIKSKKIVCFIDPKQQTRNNQISESELEEILEVEGPRYLLKNYRNAQDIAKKAYEFARENDKEKFPEIMSEKADLSLFIFDNDGDEEEYYEWENYHLKNLIEERAEDGKSIGIFVSASSNVYKVKECLEEIPDIEVYTYETRHRKNRELDFSKQKDITKVYIFPYSVIKGLEFDTVMMTRIGKIKRTSMINNSDNLLYIAMTRAKEELFIFQDSTDGLSEKYYNVQKLQSMIK